MSQKKEDICLNHKKFDDTDFVIKPKLIFRCKHWLLYSNINMLELNWYLRISKSFLGWNILKMFAGVDVCSRSDHAVPKEKVCEIGWAKESKSE